ncbi:hypothetical protein GCM10009119_19520 [Algoriphagus jejuensis]|uniref:Uncharacterized protein n=1 Tax=Algoriphagus jejuensis TaxID=419934 RepID=A0ABP3YDS8_9BACT
MVRTFYTFMEIIKLNDHNWEKAHFMLAHFMERGILKKENRGPEDIIYHVCGQLHDYQLLYDRMFNVPDRDSEPMRIKRKRIENPN